MEERLPPTLRKKTGGLTAKDRKQLLVYLDVGLIKDLKMAAVQRDTSASAIAGDAIAAWLKSRGLLTPQRPSVEGQR
jgi:hypothetical protein